MPTSCRRLTDSRNASFFEMSRWVRNISAIWFPTRWPGFRAVSGSWKIMLSFAPRYSRISSGGSFRRSSPRKNTCPEMRASLRVTSPITVSQLTLLPEPDSPTTPIVSPGEIENDTPSTAFTRPSSVGKCTLRSLTSSNGSATRPPIGYPRVDPLTGQSLLAPEPLVRVQGVAEPIDDEVHGEDGDEDHHAGEPDQPGSQQHERLAIVQQITPGGRGRHDPEPEERQRRLGQDGARHQEGHVHDDRPQRVRHDVVEDDPLVGCSRRPGGLDVFLLLQR